MVKETNSDRILQYTGVNVEILIFVVIILILYKGGDQRDPKWP